MSDNVNMDDLSRYVSRVMDTKLSDWTISPEEEARQEKKARQEAAEKLRDAAEMIMGFCHVDPNRSCIPRTRVKRLANEEARRASMSPKQRAFIDLTKAAASARLKIMEREGLTFDDMHALMEEIPC